MRGTDADARGRGGLGGRCRAFTEHRIVGVELPAERDGLLPGLALALRNGIELRRDRLEGRRLVVLSVDLKQLEVDLLPVRIFLEGVFEDFLGLRIAPIGEVHLGLGDRIDFVRIDAAETFAAEIGGERILARIDDAAARRPNTVLVLMSVPPMMLSSNLTVRVAAPRSGPPYPPTRRTRHRRSPIRVGSKTSSNQDDSLAGALRVGLGRRLGGGATSAARRPQGRPPWRPRPGRLRLGGSTLGGSTFGGSGAFISGAGTPALGGSAFAGSGALPACATCAPPGCPLSSSAFCRSFNVFSRSLMRACASFRALSRDTTSSTAEPGAPLPACGDTLS
jgi:hypothetical protein